MAAVTKAANAHTAVSGAGFTNPSNAYATTGDNVYATATLTSTTNSTVSGDFGFPNFTTVDIPTYSTVTSVVLNTEYAISASVTGLATGIQIYRNGVAQGTEVTRTTLTEAAATQTVAVTNDAPISLADLRTASTLLKGRVRIAKGNTANLSTLSLDYISLTVNYNAPSTVSTLSALSFSAGSISPTFASGTTSYSFSVPYATSTTTLTATATGPTGGGFLMEYRLGAGAWTSLGTTSPQTSGSIALAVGTNTIDVRVTAQDGITQTTYTTTITRNVAVSTLSALSFTAGTLSPTFASGTTTYTIGSIPYATSTTTFAATATGPTGMSFAMDYRVNGGSWTALTHTSGVVSASPSISLAVGATVVDVRVTGQDGVTQSTYTTTLTRVAASTNADLSAMAFVVTATPAVSVPISPTFSSTVTTYTAAVDNTITQVTVSATRSSALASALDYRLRGGAWTSFAGTGSADLTLTNWANLVEVRVTAESGATKTYATTVTQVEPYDFQTYITVNGQPVGGSVSMPTTIKWGND